MVVRHETPVLVVGAGPAGLIAALQLARNGVECMLAERNPDTTKWPKMDITNCRSMEILRRLGMDQGMRAVGVPQKYSADVLVSTGLTDPGSVVAKWNLDSPDQWRTRILEQNDGSMPREPYQRCSQAVFEAWLKPQIQAEPLINAVFGLKFEKLTETDGGVESELSAADGEQYIVKSQYVIGCDGAGSRVRKSIGSVLEGGPVPGASFLIHFKSYDLTRLQKQGQFWHIFFTKGATIIAQDEECMWTIHVPVDIDADISQIDPVMAVYEGLGGEFAPFEIKIDEIFVTSKWRPNIYLANRYTSASGRVFISGDAAHQNIPTGGYGMNTAVGDSFDIGWKVAAAVKGHGGKFLLKSYELERRPVGARNIERSGVHAFVHVTYRQWCAEAPEVITSAGEDGVALREKIRQHVETNNGENTNYGIEMDYRYTGSPVVVSDTDGSQEPAWTPTAYTPSTWPGARAPQVILADGKTSIFDLFGRGNKYSLVDFTPEAAYVQAFRPVAESLKIPLEFIHLPEEKHVREIWGRDSVFVRPDDHVAWRAPSSGASAQGLDVEHILLVATGQREAEHIGNGDLLAAPHSAPTFTGTVGNVEHNKVEGLGAFQT